MSLRDLYQEIIIDHGKTPRNLGVLPLATHKKQGHNPLCGDQLTLYIQTKMDVIEAVKFEGKGCAISVASASILTEMVQGKSIKEVNALFHAFHALVTEGQAPDLDIGKLAVFAGVVQFPARVKCATLAWHTFKAALDNNSDTITTEK